MPESTGAADARLLGVIQSPSVPTNRAVGGDQGQSPGGGALLGAGWEARDPTVEVSLNDPNHWRFDRDSAVLSAFAAHVDDGSVVGAADVANVGADQLVGTQAGKQRGEDQCTVAFDPITTPSRLWIVLHGAQQCGDRAAEMRWPDVPTRCIAAKYPGRVAMCCSLAVVVACGQGANGFIEGRWKMNRHARQIDGYRVGCDRYFVPGEGTPVLGLVSKRWAAAPSTHRWHRPPL
jgi:hypothetical protein